MIGASFFIVMGLVMWLYGGYDNKKYVEDLCNKIKSDL